MKLTRKLIEILFLLSTLETVVTSTKSDNFQLFQPKQSTAVRQSRSTMEESPEAVPDDSSAVSTTKDRAQPNLGEITKDQLVKLLAAASQQEGEDSFTGGDQPVHLPVRRSITAEKSISSSPPIKKHLIIKPSEEEVDLGSKNPGKSQSVNSPIKDLTGNNPDVNKALASLMGLHRSDLASLTKDQVVDLLSSLSSDSIEGGRADFNDDTLSDSELRSNTGELSKTCGIAMRAAEEAKAASQAQNSAGLQAAREVKLQLAEKAQRASNAAQAALYEKQNEIHMLEDQMHDAETVMLEEHDSLNQTRQNVETAGKTVQRAREQYKALEIALKLSKETIASAEELAQGAEHEFNEKVKLMTAAKSKVAELARELERAKKEYSNTHDSAVRAAEAAKEAQINANQNNK